MIVPGQSSLVVLFLFFLCFLLDKRDMDMGMDMDMDMNMDMDTMGWLDKEGWHFTWVAGVCLLG